MKKTIAMVMAAFLALPAWASVNLNTATQSELEAVRGLGPVKAKAIIHHRDTHGKFRSVEDLEKVKGIGKATVEKLRSELTIGDEAPKKR